jgi:hypothetical protein
MVRRITILMKYVVMEGTPSKEWVPARLSQATKQQMKTKMIYNIYRYRVGRLMSKGIPAYAI